MVGKIIKVLICDDSLLVRKTLKKSLDEIGEFAFAEAENGDASLEMYKDFQPDLVFMDIVMPGKDGIQVLKKIKNYDGKANVVMLSSSGTQSHLKQAIDAGAIDFIQKPWEKYQLLSVIARLVREREVQ